MERGGILDFNTAGSYYANQIFFKRGVKMKISIYEVLFWIFFAIAIITILWYIFGSSPTLEQVLLILILTFLFKIQATTISNGVEIKNLRKKFGLLEDSFIKLVRDFKKYVK